MIYPPEIVELMNTAWALLSDFIVAHADILRPIIEAIPTQHY